jgi:hypothetical protein
MVTPSERLASVVLFVSFHVALAPSDDAVDEQVPVSSSVP